MIWRATTSDGNELLESVETTLKTLQTLYLKSIESFIWCDCDGNPKLGCNVPEGAQLVAFVRRYISTDGSKNAVYVAGWRLPTSCTICFLQPDGLVEVADYMDYPTAFELRMGT